MAVLTVAEVTTVLLLMVVTLLLVAAASVGAVGVEVVVTVMVVSALWEI